MDLADDIWGVCWDLGGGVRFDDLLATMLRQDSGEEGGIATLWAQIADVLAQQRPSISVETRENALARLRVSRAQVPVARRRAVARAIAAYCQSTELVMLFATDLPSVAAPLLSQVRLGVRDWAEIIPALPVFARALIRERRDLPAIVAHMLKSYGASDFALPPPANEEDDTGVASSTLTGEEQAPDGSARSIANLAARVAAFKLNSKPAGDAGAKEQSAMPSQQFWFSTGADGVIRHVEGAPAEAVVGTDMSRVAVGPYHGVDGRAAGAFRDRQPYREAHLRLAGAGHAAGDWLISGLPCFAPDTGRFLGYRGLARRVDMAKIKPQAADQRTFAVGKRDDSNEALRQFIHEMRTPLNAVCGFVEMILAQFHGPVAASYQKRAREVLADAQIVTTVFEDLQTVADMKGIDGRVPQAAVDLGTAVKAGLNAAERQFGRGASRFALHLPEYTLCGWLDEALISGAVYRAGVLLLSQYQGEATIPVRLSKKGGEAVVTFAWPERIAPIAAEPSGCSNAIFPLGEDFARRLLEQMARKARGRFVLNGQDMSLHFPLAANAAAKSLA